MISLETISRVRLDHFKHGRSIKEIVRLRGISRNSVRKIIRSDGISDPHYLVEPTACSPAAGWEKGQVENQVKNGRDAFFKPRQQAQKLAELNARLYDQKVERAKRMSHPDLPDKTVSVARTCLVRFERNKYSVKTEAIGRPVHIHAYANRIVILQNGKIVGGHERCFGRGKAIYNPWHYVPILARKPPLGHSL